MSLFCTLLSGLLNIFFPELLVAFSASLASEPSARLPRDFDKSTRVLDDTAGRISEILINVSLEERDDMIPVIEDLLDRISPQIRLTFACSDESCVEAIQNRVAQPREHFPWKMNIVLTNFRLTPWARDRRIARSGSRGEERFSLVPPAKDFYGVDRRNEIRLPYLLNDLELAPEPIPLPFLLDGGNVVTDSHFAFIGGNNIEANRKVIPNLKDLKRMLKLYLGTPVVHVFAGQRKVPWDHIDMYVTPLPNKRVIVASPNLAKEIFAASGETHPITKQDFLSLSFDLERSRLFDQVASQFKKLGYQVIRIPAVPHYLDQWMITYNNVLMDFRDQKSIVYLPSYGVRSLDRYAQQTYRDLDFQVHAVDLSTLYRNGGALRCLANVTRRLPPQQRASTEKLAVTREINIHRPGRWELQRINPPTVIQTSTHSPPSRTVK